MCFLPSAAPADLSIFHPSYTTDLQEFVKHFVQKMTILPFTRTSEHIREPAPHEHAHGRGHHQAARPAGGVAQAVQTGHVRVERVVHGDAVAVKLQLRGIQQRLIGGEAGHDLVHGLDEVDDVEHGAVRHGGRDVARNGVRQCGADVRLRELLLPRALAVEDIAEALHHDVPCAEHIRHVLTE